MLTSLLVSVNLSINFSITFNLCNNKIQVSVTDEDRFRGNYFIIIIIILSSSSTPIIIIGHEKKTFSSWSTFGHYISGIINGQVIGKKKEDQLPIHLDKSG